MDVQGNEVGLQFGVFPQSFLAVRSFSHNFMTLFFKDHAKDVAHDLGVVRNKNFGHVYPR